MTQSNYAADQMGSATLSPAGEFIAGDFASFELVYTAGTFGIDDTGSLKIVHRFASDMGKPQFHDPQGWNYTTVEASNGAVLRVEYDNKRNVRPWDKTLYIQVVRGFLKEGDTITVRFGDPRQGSPGLRIQTFHEPTAEFKVLVDAFATYQYTEIIDSPTISVVAGPPVAYKLVLPTLRAAGEDFRLSFKGEDKWGNPSHRVEGVFTLRSNTHIDNLPERFEMRRGEYARTFEGLRVATPCEIEIEVFRDDEFIVRSTPCRIMAPGIGRRHYWADLHGQSEETIGTNSARELIEFARDRAFLDAMSHQGNDFQITQEFWEHLNTLTEAFNQDGRFIIFPGYEWSGNTGLGGDRNVMYLNEGRPLHRSSHALVADKSDLESDANSVGELFRMLKDEDAIVFAHIGGRYADISIGHDARIERSIEIHSDWGTFEWLLEDALNEGYRVGILANSDGHKGRQGASYPGASLFGAYGGLSCLIADELTRSSLAEALRQRRHYATTGCRAFLQVRGIFEGGALLYSEDPQLDPQSETVQVNETEMGNIVAYDGEFATFEFELSCDAPVENIEIRNRMEVLHTLRPFDESTLGKRIRIYWEGSEYRGRGRQTVWDGNATLSGNTFERATSFNFWNLDQPLRCTGNHRLDWKSLTTGGFSGVEVSLTNASEGELIIDTNLVKTAIRISDIGLEPLVFEAGGMGRRLKVYRLPDDNPVRRMNQRVQLPLHSGSDNVLYMRATTEDGFFIYSSPIYVIKK